MVTSQKHHYTNNHATQNTFIIAYVAISMAREGSYLNMSKINILRNHADLLRLLQSAIECLPNTFTMTPL